MLKKNMSKTKEFIAILNSEIRANFTPLRMTMLILAIALSLLTTGVLFNSEFAANLDFQSQTYSFAPAQAFVPIASGGIFLIIFKISFALSDKSTLDKNRVAYLQFSKHQVLAAKILADILLIFAAVVLLIFVTNLAIIIRGKVSVPGSFWGKEIVFLVSITMFYALTIFIAKLILAAVQDKTIRGLIIGFWLAIMLGSLIVWIQIVANLEDFRNFYIDNQKILAVIPIINIPYMVLSIISPKVELWTVIPAIATSIIVIAATWKIAATSIKEYLAA